MMTLFKQKSIILFIVLIFCQGCGREKNPVNSQSFLIFQGSWEGTLDNHYLLITLIEGKFEDSPTLTGSAYLGPDSQATPYLIMNGTHNGKDSLWFALYKTPITGKEEFHLKGSIVYNNISGVFTQFAGQNKIISKGNWQVKRVP